MRFVTFETPDGASFGMIAGDEDVVVAEGLGWADLSDVAVRNDWAALARALDGRSPTRRLTDLTLAPPIPRPGKIVCVGVNYPDRNAEYRDGSDAPQFMSLFPRFPSSFTGHDRPLVRPPESHMLDYEGEIALVIGRPGRRIAREEAFDHIGAVTLANEGTIRDWVRHAKFNVTQGKNWDRSGAMGPWVMPFTGPDMIEGVRLTTRVNGEVRQDDTTDRMIFSFADIVAYVSTFTTLEAGDILVTGTPTGAGARLDPPRFLAPGDVVEVSVDGIGTLRNTVADEVVA